MNPEHINAIYFAAGGLSVGLPLTILLLASWRAIKDWQYLCTEAQHKADGACHNFHSLHAQYLSLIQLYRSRESRESDVDDSEKWKLN